MTISESMQTIRLDEKMELNEKTSVLIEALPYIKRFKDKTFVVKFGGNAMSTMDHVIEDIVLLKHIGINPIIVHGGGPEIDAELKKAGIMPRFMDGLRYTDGATIEIVERALKKINDELVSRIKSHGANSCNLQDCIRARLKDPKLGLVGDITDVDSARLFGVLNNDSIPVISPIGFGPDGEKYNINADTAASYVAVALKAEKLTILTNVDGVILDDKIMPHIDVHHAEEEIRSGRISKGMIPKVEACIYAVNNRCSKAHLINGLVPHSLLLEIFTDKGVGTEIVLKNGYQKHH